MKYTIQKYITGEGDDGFTADKVFGEQVWSREKLDNWVNDHLILSRTRAGNCIIYTYFKGMNMLELRVKRSK